MQVEKNFSICLSGYLKIPLQKLMQLFSIDFIHIQDNYLNYLPEKHICNWAINSTESNHFVNIVVKTVVTFSHITLIVVDPDYCRHSLERRVGFIGCLDTRGIF